ncbi:MAG: TlpA family protein disulfide reductase [Luminiphilus sp.]|jgi:thiol-disulfide isomerase/thioredoxin|nr:TlpA family protein disulfide reductase [Luminiphilus sp.]MBL6820349.1 TlpA family protein disulfide reductase [Luminiphilus sp.]
MKRLLCCITALLSLWGCESDPLPGNGQWRIINYWAIWCAPCREEIPELNELDRSTELVVLAVNYDGKTGDELASQAAEMGITFALLEQDPRATLSVARPKVLPTTLLVSPDGQVTDTLVGPQTREGLLALWQTRR